jgi:hypothetical protein
LNHRVLANRSFSAGLAALLIACSAGSTSTTAGAGGDPSVGGTVSKAGATGNGGAMSAGGTLSLGGVAGNGDANAAAGVTSTGGVPFFPVGAYVVSWSLSTPAILDDLQQIKAAGFNTAHLGLSNDDLTILDRAEELGLKIIVEGADPAQVTRLMSHPALLAWNIQDEPDINGVSPTDVQAKRDSIKSLDSAHPTLVVVTDPAKYQQYAGIPDVFGIDPYINHYSATPISYVGDCTASALGLRDSVLVVAHAFQEGGRFLLPTVAQERSIVYQALVNGADALLFFAFHAPPSDNWYMPDSSEFFGGVKTLLGELGAVGPILAAAPSRQSLAVSTSGVKAVHVVADAKNYVLVVSSLEQPASGVRLTLGWDATSATALFENRPIPVSGQGLVDDIDAYGSHVYEIE